MCFPGLYKPRRLSVKHPILFEYFNMQRSFIFRRSQRRDKLTKIQSELKIIQNNQSNDISSIRNQIEKASLRFTEAQKRFEVVEKDYNSALIELVKSKEEKVLLVSLLSSVIEQNEIKKAQKLSELVEKFEISSRPPILDKTKIEPESVDQESKENNTKN